MEEKATTHTREVNQVAIIIIIILCDTDENIFNSVARSSQ